MPENYQTEQGRRQDLEAIETNPVLGFIGTKILPVVNTAEKSGTVFFKTLVVDSAAQTDRTPGTAPARTLLTDSSDTFSVAEAVKRYGVCRDEVKQMGGIEKADRAGGQAAKRSVQRKLEADTAMLVLKNSTCPTSDILDSLIKAVDVGLESIRRYAGKNAFVCSAKIFGRIMRYTEITARFSLSSLALSGIQATDVIMRKPEALRMALSSILGVDEVLIGDDNQWYDQDGAMADRAALVKLPDVEELSHKLDPVFGKTMQYLPDGKQPFIVESFYDPQDHTNNYDAWIWYSLKKLNTNAMYLLSGIDEGQIIVTTTAATTTATTTT